MPVITLPLSIGPKLAHASAVLGFIQALPLEVSPDAVLPQSVPAAATAVDFGAILASITSTTDVAPQPAVTAHGSPASPLPPTFVSNVLLEDLAEAIEPASMPALPMTAPNSPGTESQPAEQTEQPEETEQQTTLPVFVSAPVETWTQQPPTPAATLGWITSESGNPELEATETEPTAAPESGNRSEKSKAHAAASPAFELPEIRQQPVLPTETRAPAPVDASVFVQNLVVPRHDEPPPQRAGAGEIHHLGDVRPSEQPSPGAKKLALEPVAFEAVVRPSDSEAAAPAPEQPVQQSTPPAPRKTEAAPNRPLNELPHSEAPTPKADTTFAEVVPEPKSMPVAAGTSSTNTVERPPSTEPPAPVMQTLPQDRPSTAEPVRNVSIRLDAPEADPVHVRMTDRGGSIHVAVHTPAPDLARNLGDRLPELVQQLDRSGYSAHVWKPETQAAETVHRISSGFESSVNSGGTGSNADPRSYGEQTDRGAYSRSAQDSSFSHAGEDRHSRGRQYEQEINEIRSGRPTPAEAEEIEQWQA